MPAHRALECYDVLQEVFRYFMPTNSEHPMSDAVKTNRKALTASARVCRAFHEHAIDSLWRDMDCLEPMLKLLPSVTAFPSADNSVDTSYRLREPISPLEWERFHHYARRVRKFEIRTAPYSASRDAMLVKLSLANGGKRLFPFLLTLVWTTQVIGFEKAMLVFTTPSLRNLTIQYDGGPCAPGRFKREDRAFSSLLHAISIKAPLLDKFQSRGIGHPFSLAPMAACQRLRVVKIDTDRCNSHFFRVFSKLKNLVVFECDLWTLPRTDSSVFKGFPALQDLSVAGSQNDITHFLATVTSRQLHSIRMKMRASEEDSAERWQLLFFTLASRFPSLRTISLYVKGEVSVPLDAPLHKVVQPLMTLHDLEKLSLSFSSPLRFSPGSLLSFAAAWPKLRSFRYYSDRSTGPVNPQVLAEFASLCPQLRTLVLPVVDFRSLHRGNARLSSFPATVPGLRTLEVGHPSAKMVGDPATVAEFITHVFPNVEVKGAVDAELHRTSSSAGNL